MKLSRSRLQVATGRMGGGAAVGPSPLLSNLVSYYKLDEASGTRVDVFGPNDVYEINGTMGQATGKIGKALQVNVSDGFYLQRQLFRNLPRLSAWDFTVTFWANLHTLSSVGIYRGIVDISNEGGYGFQAMVAFNQVIAWYLMDGPGNTMVLHTTVPSLDAWHWYALQFDATNDLLIVNTDNADKLTQSGAHTIPDIWGSPIHVGTHRTLANQFDGQIDEIGIWASAPGAGGVLTDVQLTQLYNGGAGLAFPFGGSTPTKQTVDNALILDAFTAVDGTGLNGQKPAPTDIPDSAWYGTGFDVLGNRAHTKSATGTLMIGLDTFVNNLSVTATITLNNTDGAGIFGRAEDISCVNGWAFTVNRNLNNLVELVEITGGGQTVRASAAAPAVPGTYTLNLSFSETNIVASIDGTPVLNYTSSDHQLGTYVGLYAHVWGTTRDTYWSNFTVTALSY